MKKLGLISLVLIAGCSTKNPKVKSKVFVRDLGAFSLTKGAAFESSSFSTSFASRRELQDKPWQWRSRNALGAGPQSPTSPIFISDSEALITTLGGGISIWDLNHNKKLWGLEIPIGVAAEPLLTEDSIYFVGMDAFLRKLDRKTKNEIWKLRLSSESIGGIAKRENILYVTTADNAVWSVDSNSGKSLWVYKRPTPESSVFWSLRGHSKPVFSLDSEKLFVGFSDGVVLCLDAQSGQTKWERRFEKNSLFKDADTTPVLSRSGAEIFVSVVDGDLVSMNSKDGGVLWSLRAGSHEEPSYNAKEEVLYVPTSDSRLLKVSARSGQQIWALDLGTRGLASTPHLMNDGVLAVSTTHGGLLLIDEKTSEILWEKAFGGGTVSKPSGTGTVFYVLNARNVLFSFSVKRN